MVDTAILEKIIACQSEVATAGLDLDLIMDLIAERSRELTGADGAAVELVEGDEMVYRAANGAAQSFRGLRLKSASSLSGRCVRESALLYCEDTETDPRVDRAATRRVGMRAMIVMPLFCRGQTVGVLKVMSRTPGAFQSSQSEILRHLAASLSGKLLDAADFAVKADNERHAQRRLNDLVAELRRANADLREAHLANQQFKTSFALSKVGLCIVDGARRFVEVNAAFCEMLGYAPSELLGLGYADITHPADLQASQELVQRMISGEIASFIVDKRYLRKDGSPVWGQSSLSMVRDEEGRAVSVVAIVQDIDALKRTESALREAVSVREEFMSIASHELRTPLTSMKLHAQLMQRSLLRQDGLALVPGEVSKMVERTERGLDRMSRLVDDMLDSSRIEGGKLPIHREPEDLASLIHETVERFVPQLRQQGIEVSVEAPAGLLVEIDRFRIEQVLTNLLTNAIRYAPRTALEISLRATPDRAVLTVRDHGPGIAPENQARVFERFERLVSVRDVSGMGLGLYITKEIVKAHGGAIRLESALGHGASFVVELPR